MPTDKGNITMRHLAQAAGVTSATVSMALRNHPRISESTRVRIHALACELGYTPNPYVSALMRQRRSNRPDGSPPSIAVVNTYKQKDAWINHRSPTVRQMRRGVLERASKCGYHTEEFWLCEPGMRPERLSDILYARGISGIVFGPFPDHFTIPSMKWDQLCAVAMTVPQPSITIPTVCSDHYFAMLRTMQECYRLGYRRPGLVLERHLIARFHGRWEAGYRMAADFLEGLEPLAPYQFDGSAFTGRELERWLAENQPDMIITTIPETMERELAALGLAVPRDIGLVSTGVPMMGYPISGIYQNGYMIGECALDAVAAMMERNECGLPEQATSIMIEGQWNPGATLRRENQAPVATHSLQTASRVAIEAVSA